MTEFIKAVETNNIEEVKRMMQSGIDLNYRNNNGNTALMYAIMYNRVEIARMLIDSGVDVNIRDNRDNTALIWTILFDNIEISRMLINVGADINIPGDRGRSALIWAIQSENTKFAKLFINSGADLYIRDITGKTALDYISKIDDNRIKKKYLRLISQREVGANLGDKLYIFKKIPTLKQLAYRQLKQNDNSGVSHKQKIDLAVLLSRFENESDKQNSSRPKSLDRNKTKRKIKKQFRSMSRGGKRKN